MSGLAVSFTDPLAGLADTEVLVIGLAALCWGLLILQVMPGYLGPRTGHGIFGLQIAWWGTRAHGIVETWRRRCVDGAAKRSLLTDVPFIALYVLLFVAIAVLVAHRAEQDGVYLPEETQMMLRFATIGAVVAGCCDVLENIGLYVQLRGHTWTGLSNVTTVLAVAKWGLLIILAHGIVALGLCVLLDCLSA